jgi:23S rRNA (cytosine1962-C5)-methyltransferase
MDRSTKPVKPLDHQYELIDFGDGRKLERFGTVVVDRPCPAAEGLAMALPGAWREAVARYDGSRVGDGDWSPSPKRWVPDDWSYAHSVREGKPEFRLQLDALPSGQVGVFTEQCENWDWIGRMARKVAGPSAIDGQSLRVLNLFAYTGASTLAAAAAGAEVVHLDAARGVVDRARTNADLSGLGDRPIRWIAEDALKFCRREVKRGNRYEGVILDPPTYGHGPKGESWKINEDLLQLLRLCGELTSESRAFVLVTCHAPGIGPAEISAYLSEGLFGHCRRPPEAGELFLQTAAGRRLPSGVYARWPA